MGFFTVSLLQAHDRYLRLKLAINGAFILCHGGPTATNVAQVLKWRAHNGADLLGLKTGQIAEGYVADLVLYSLDAPRYSGVHSLLEAPILCGEPTLIKHSFVNGKRVVESGQELGVDEAKLIQDVKAAVLELLAKSPAK